MGESVIPEQHITMLIKKGIGILVSWLLFNSGIVPLPHPLTYMFERFLLLLPPFSITLLNHIDPSLAHFISSLRILTFNPHVSPCASNSPFNK